MKFFFIYLTLFVLVFACSSDNDAMPEQTEVDNFYALTIGNSWVYKNYRYNNVEQTYDMTSVIDSVSIVGTEVLNGNTYYKFRRNTTGNDTNITFCNENGVHFELLRDSLGYLVRSDGSIKFTNSDYNERLIVSNSGINIYETLKNETSTLVVAAGTFECIYSERYAKDSNNILLAGKDNFFYADGKGLIYDTSSFASQPIPIIIRRLDSYNVN